jgi:hypothetical protein
MGADIRTEDTHVCIYRNLCHWQRSLWGGQQFELPYCGKRWVIDAIPQLRNIQHSNFVAVQGLGAGGLASLCHIILSDLVPLEERGVFNGLIAMYVPQIHVPFTVSTLSYHRSYTVANGIGPVVG